MIKILYWVTFTLLKLKAKLLDKKLKHLAKDYLIYGNTVIEIDKLKAIKRFSYKDTVMHLSGAKFLINGETVVDIEDGIKVLHHGVDVRKNTLGIIIDNKQYDNDFELLDEGDVEVVLYNMFVTKTKVKKGFIYRIVNSDGESLHQFPVGRGKMAIDKEGDFVTFGLGKNSKKLHVGGFKNVIEEYKK